MNQYLFTYWDECSKVIQLIEAETLTAAINIFLSRKVSNNIDFATSFQIKKVVS